MGFKDQYLKDFAKYQEFQLQQKVDFYQGMIDDPINLEKYNERNRQLYMSKRHANARWFTPVTAEDIKKGKLAFAKRQMANPTIRLMGYLNEANQGFETKIQRVIEKVFHYRPDTRFLKVEDIRNIGSEFSFLITNEDMEIHARVIYVNGVLVCPHYRFIITKRNK